MIPKIIHYCWFGNADKPKLFYKCYSSWKKYCKDFKIIEWNGNNFDIRSAPLYVQQAYHEKKWAFVTDYVRLKVVYEYGGVYLDTDVELKKHIDKLLTYTAFFGFEDQNNVATGLGFGAVPKYSLVKEMMEDYNSILFVLPDGTFDTTPCPERNTKILIKKGLRLNDSIQIIDDNVLILPSIYMCPIDYHTGHYRRSLKTISVHWFSASWHTAEQKQLRKSMVKQAKKYRKRECVHNFIHLPNRILRIALGAERYDSLKNILKK